MSQLTRRVVPWKNRKEFECVYNEVFGNDPQLQTHAVGRIDVWRSRVLHKIPVAIDSTAAIVHAKLHHLRAVESKQDKKQDNEIRSSYSLALIRFVNHITEKGQVGEYAQPVHVLASKFGVPEWIVELRHDATHRQLPPLSILISACDWALSWLKTEFWKEQLSSMARKVDKRKIVAGTADKSEVQGILVEYQHQKFQEIDEKSSKEMSWKIIKDLERVPVKKREELVTCLVENGFIIPTQEQLKALRIDPSKLNTSSCTLPDMFILFWKPVLQLLHQLKLTNNLLIKLASKITKKTCMQNYILCGWIHTIVSSNEQANNKNSRRSPTLLYKWSVPLTVRPVLGSLVHTPCDHTIPLITKLLELGQEKGEYTETQVTLINTLMNRVQPSLPVELGGTNGLEVQDKTIYTLEDIKSRKRKLENSEDDIRVKVCSQSMWQICEDDVDWSQIPIGILPGQTLDYLTLDLSTNIEESVCDSEQDSSSDEDADAGMMELEETCHQDEDTSPCSSWSFLQMAEIKRGVRLL